jgi:hypothetical protein
VLESLNYILLLSKETFQKGTLFVLSRKSMKNIPFDTFGAADFCIWTKDEKKRAGDKG